MTEQLLNLAWSDVLMVLVCLVLIMQLYNLFCTTRENAHKFKRQKEQPSITINNRVEAVEHYLDNDKRRLEEHDRQIADIRGGQKAICSGVQALLEHELHNNGNSDEMETASKEINTWLKNRP